MVEFRAAREPYVATRIRLDENAVCFNCLKQAAVMRALPLLTRSRPLNPVTHS